MRPIIDEHDVTVHLGDVRERLAELPARSVQCCVTSPPYYGLRDYGVDGQIGLEPSPGEYVAEMVAVFAEVQRVLADDGVLWLNLGDSYQANAGNNGGYSDKSTMAGFTNANTKGRQANDARRALRIRSGVGPKNMLGIPWRVAFALQDDGWTLRNAVIWNKPNAMPESVTDRLSCRYEHVFLFSKSRRYRFDLDAVKVTATGRPGGNTDASRMAYAAGPGTEQASRRFGGNPTSTLAGAKDIRNPGDVWTIPTSPFPGAHFATMPPELARRCILAGCPEGATVLDPFTGSGTTAKVARSLGRRFVGIELNPDYIPIIRDRIGQEPFDFGEAAL